MSSNLLARLESLAHNAPTELERSIYGAQWAAAMARLGHIERARSAIVELRAVNAAYNPNLTAWILIAEGLADHYESLSANALDRFKRAYGLARSIGDKDILGFASAWMAASEFLLGDYRSAATHAIEAIESAPLAGPVALSRAHLVLANILYTIGIHPLASIEYTKARNFAVEARDISMQSAVLYNLAAFRIARLSLEDAVGIASSADIATAELELNSVSNLDTGIGVGSLGAMIPVLRAQLALVNKKWAEANEHYSEAIPEAATYGQLRWESRFLAEQSQSQAMLGLWDSAEALARKAIDQLSERVDLDDLAACHARLSLCFDVLGKQAESLMHSNLSKQYVARYSAWQAAHRERVESLIASALDHRS